VFIFGRQIRLDFSDRNQTFAGSVLKLVGHLMAAGVVFVSFFTIVWSISGIVSWLNSVHKLPDEILEFMTRFEVWFMYADSVLCILVLLVGVGRFVADLGRR